MLVGVVSLLIGTFTALGGLLDLEFFMRNRRAAAVIALIGRPGARVFYSALGLFFIGAGLAMIRDAWLAGASVPGLP